MSEILVDVKNLTKEYKRGDETLVVLDNLNLQIPKQDYLALMGPSGSGKSTLLNLIGGLDTPSDGSVSINGERIDQMNSKQLSNWRATNVGFIFQFYNLLPVLSAQKNIELPLLLTNLSNKQRKKHVETALNINLLNSLNEDHGKTILMVTHDPTAADSAKRSLHLDKGKLIT